MYSPYCFRNIIMISAETVSIMIAALGSYYILAGQKSSYANFNISFFFFLW